MENKESFQGQSHQESKKNIDYSEIYRNQELKQLEKRLNKTRNILLICAAFMIGGALFFWTIHETAFKSNDFLPYACISFFLILLAFYSKRRPYISILTALITCLLFWGAELILKNTDEYIIEGSIQKLIIISLLVISLHASKEAELIRKELHFS